MATTKPTIEGRESIWCRWHLGALLAHVVLTAIFTWPLALNLFSNGDVMLPGTIIVDRDQNLWNLWWVREAVLSGRNPFVTDLIWHPEGVSLYFHTLNLFNGLLAIPLLSLFSLPSTYNIIVFFSFVMAGWGAFLLVFRVCGNRWGALVGSVVFAYSAYHIATLRGLLQLISLEWVPFFILFLLRAVLAPATTGARQAMAWVMKYALPASVMLLLVALVDWYYTMYSLMLAGLVGIYYLAHPLWYAWRRRTPLQLRDVARPLARLTICLTIFGVLVSPILVPTIAELRSQTYMVPSPNEAIANSADLAAFFLPTRDNKLWGDNFRREGWAYASNLYEVYLTYTALALGGVGLLSRRLRRPPDPNPSQPIVSPPGKWFWAVCALLFFGLALGPVLQVGGTQVRYLFGSGLELPMPYRLIEGVPGLNISRSPDRFTMPLTLCLGVLTGIGTKALAGWSRGSTEEVTGEVPVDLKSTRMSRPALVGLSACALITLELVPMPYPHYPAETPRWYETVKQEPGDFTILELPAQDDYWHGAFRMYHATVHGRPIFGGYISREFPHPFLENTPGYNELVAGAAKSEMLDQGRDEWLSALARHETRYVVLQKDRLPGLVEELVDVTTWREPIERVLGVAPLYEDEQLVAYRVPAPGALVPYITIGESWEPLETGPNGSFRWMRDEATLVLEAPSHRDAFLHFSATTIGPERELRILYGDKEIFSERVGALRDFRIGPLPMPPGESTLTLLSPNGTVSPLELGIGDDPRRLGFALLRVKLVPADSP